MNSAVYNIPARLYGAYRGRKLILRTHDPAELPRRLSTAELEDILYVRLLSPHVGVEALTRWGESVPIDILLGDPAEEFSLLYNFSNLLDKHPVRASITVRPGCGKAVALALALNFAVKLEVGQPDAALIEEMAEILERYLHQPTVSQPVEYFHSVFLSFVRREPSSLWLVQEEDPEQFRFVTDEGVETSSPRFAGVAVTAGSRGPRGAGALPGGRSECDDCAFLDQCGGYFKWPDREFGCEGVKRLFGMLEEAAWELRADLDGLQASRGGARR